MVILQKALSLAIDHGLFQKENELKHIPRNERKYKYRPVPNFFHVSIGSGEARR